MAALLALVLAASGLHGIVTRGPTAPVCRVGTPCTEPAVGVVLVFSRDGRIVSRVRAGVGGRYAIRLRPGVYAVRVSPAQKIGGLTPRRVRVGSGVNRRLDFEIDTGIR